ncbi:MAG: hypothetical protein CBD18_06595 [Opitutales bacterium TMED158]|nr:MAG: hypothetical protein CBD18_06595 [Opitutales bacterium TMED158]
MESGSRLSLDLLTMRELPPGDTSIFQGLSPTFRTADETQFSVGFDTKRKNAFLLAIDIANCDKQGLPIARDGEVGAGY